MENNCKDDESEHGQPAHDKPDEDRNDEREEKRARTYGLKLTDLLEQSIIIGPNKYVRLSGLGRKSEERGLVRLHPKDIDDVKRWIGVPDELGARRSCCGPLPAEVPGVSSASEFRRLDANSRRAIHDLANEYVNGDSRRLSKYKSAFNHLVDRAVITGVFLREDIDIYPRAVLEIGNDIKTLFARHIRIWKGGLLKITGNTKIDCVSITGNLERLMVAAERIPSFATLLNKEMPHG